MRQGAKRGSARLIAGPAGNGKSARPPPGLYTPMGRTTPQKIANTIDNLERGLISPTELIARAG